MRSRNEPERENAGKCRNPENDGTTENEKARKSEDLRAIREKIRTNQD